MRLSLTLCSAGELGYPTRRFLQFPRTKCHFKFVKPNKVSIPFALRETYSTVKNIVGLERSAKIHPDGPTGCMQPKRKLSTLNQLTKKEMYHGAKVDPPEHNVKILKAGTDQLEKLLSKDSNRYLRLTVNSGGCSGYQYEFRMEAWEKLNVNGDDIVFEQRSDTDISPRFRPSIVVIDELSLDFLNGCEIDFTTEMIRSSFQVVKNKSAENACGCGASFSVGPSF